MRLAFALIVLLAVGVVLFAVGCTGRTAAKGPGAPPTSPQVGPTVTANEATSTSAPTEDPKALFETKCSKCHSIKRATVRREPADWWQREVRRMQKKKPGHISDDEAARIAEYLAANYGLEKK